MDNQNKVKFITKWYNFRELMCNKHNGNCKECPLYESTDGWSCENGQYEYVDNCKYSFEEQYASEIVELMEEYEANRAIFNESWKIGEEVNLKLKDGNTISGIIEEILKDRLVIDNNGIDKNIIIKFENIAN